jgi:hypothetical protein
LQQPNRVLVLLAAAAVTVLLFFLPWGRWLAWPLILISTLVHELGHGLSALLAGGQFISLNLWSDASGVAAYRGAFGPLARACVAAGGLLAPPLAASALFLAARSAVAARRALLGCALLLLVVAALWVRTLFGFGFVSLLAMLLLTIGLRSSAAVAQFSVVFLALQLSLAVFSRGDYLFMAQAQTAQGWMPSDTGQIEQALWLPYWFWGLLIALASMGILASGLRAYVRSLSGAGTAR